MPIWKIWSYGYWPIKLYFFDVGLACYLLGLNNPDHIESHPLKGALFENFIITEVMKHYCNHAKPSNLYFFRDHVGNEVDLILDRGDKLISVEIKSAQTINKSFFKGLDYYQQLAKEKNNKRTIIYAGNESYQIKDIQIFSYRDLNNFFNFIAN